MRALAILGLAGVGVYLLVKAWKVLFVVAVILLIKT